MKTLRLLALSIAVACAAPGAFGQGRSCSAEESQATEKSLDLVVNWDQLYKAFQQYGHCQSVLNEDLWTDALMRLAVQWKDVDQFARRYQGDPQFKAFVHKQFGSLMAREDVQSVYSRAKSDCPAGLDAFCTELAAAAQAATK